MQGLFLLKNHFYYGLTQLDVLVLRNEKLWEKQGNYSGAAALTPWPGWPAALLATPLFPSKVRPLQSAQARPSKLQQLFGGGALRRNRCRLPALPFCKQLACPQPRRWAEARVPPGFAGNIPMPCVSPSLGRGRARWRRGALVQMGNLLGGHRCHCLDFMVAGLNKWRVLATACELHAHEATRSDLESQLESSSRGQPELATVQGRGFVKYTFVKNAMLHRKASHSNKLIQVKNDKFWCLGR